MITTIDFKYWPIAVPIVSVSARTLIVLSINNAVGYISINPESSYVPHHTLVALQTYANSGQRPPIQIESFYQIQHRQNIERTCVYQYFATEQPGKKVWRQYQISCTSFIQLYIFYIIESINSFNSSIRKSARMQHANQPCLSLYGVVWHNGLRVTVDSWAPFTHNNIFLQICMQLSYHGVCKD